MLLNFILIHIQTWCSGDSFSVWFIMKELRMVVN